MNAQGADAVLEWAVAAAALEPWDESGDLHLVASFPGGALIAVVDGLGHGPEAAIAARAAVASLQQRPGDPPSELIQRAHEASRKTRGVVMTVVSLDLASSTFTWLGVGNVDAVLLRRDTRSDRPREAILGRAGVVGYQLPSLNPRTLPIATGDVLLLVTDGISSSFASAPEITDDLQRTANTILATHGKRDDDALVLVARYRGGAG